MLLASGAGTQTFVAPNNLTMAPDYGGQLDDISLYDTALSATTIQKLFNAGTFVATADNRLVKTGSGTLTLTQPNTFVDGTTVMEGALIAANATGSATGTGAITVQSGATFGGTGFVTGDVIGQSGGKVAPGITTSILTTGDLNLGSGAILEIGISGTTIGTQYDSLTVAGTVTLNAASTLSIVKLAGYLPTAGHTFTIIDNDGTADAVAGTFTQGTAFTLNGVQYALNYAGGDGNDVVLSVVPPSTVYVDDSFTGAPGDEILDADPVAGGSQPAALGYNAFTSVNAAIAAVTASGTVIVNQGNYASQAVVINKQVTMNLQEGRYRSVLSTTPSRLPS